ncbi:MAG: hypothetical protein R3F62_12860 [Planctomycetota bacterium]
MSDEDDAPQHPGEWEMIEDTGSGIRQWRQLVPGGWLVLVGLDEGNTAVFFPDPDHAWKPPIKQTRKRSGYF